MSGAPERSEATSDPRLDHLIGRLPSSFERRVQWLMRPAARWARWPAASLLIVGGLLGFLPVLGFWMLPLGLVLLAEDVPLLRRLRGRSLDWIERRRPHWVGIKNGSLR